MINTNYNANLNKSVASPPISQKEQNEVYLGLLKQLESKNKPSEIKGTRTLKDIAKNIENIESFFKSLANIQLKECIKDDQNFLCDPPETDRDLKGYVEKAQKVNQWIENKAAKTSYINLEGSYLANIPVGLRKLPEVDWLTLNDNKIRQIENLENLRKLDRLDLAYNRITDLSPIFEHNTNLTELRVFKNPITSLEGIENLKKLRILDIADTKIPLNELERLKELEDLDILVVSKDQIAPARLFAAKNKLEWEVDDNEDQPKVPLESNKGKNLVLQDLSLKEIPKEIEELEDLRSLYLDENEINDLSPLFHYNKNIETLYIADNPIATLEGIENLQNLRVLNIALTKINDLEPLKRLKNLKHLVVSKTQVEVAKAVLRESNPGCKIEVAKD